MVDFKMKAAGCVAAVTAQFQTTRWFCRKYLCDSKTDFALEVNAQDIAIERELDAKGKRWEGYAVNANSAAYLETIVLLRKLLEKLIEYDTLLFHGSCIAVDGIGYLFTAPSGTGKSTHTRLWREMLGDRAVMVNDDKPFLEITEHGVTAWGSPWNGKHRLDTNTGAPLKAICILERGEENRICQIPAREAIVDLFQQSGRPRDPRQMPRYMDLLDRLSANVTFYRLHCNMDSEAASVAYEAMAGADRD